MKLWLGFHENNLQLVLFLFAPMLTNMPGGGVLPETFGRGVRPASQNPYPIYDQNLRFSLPYLWPDQKFDLIIRGRAFADGFI